MKTAAVLCLLGLVSAIVGVFDNTPLPRFCRLLLDHELSQTAFYGHPVKLVVEHVDHVELEKLAAEQADNNKVTVLALGDSSALIIPSVVDAPLAKAHAWGPKAILATAGFLTIQDTQGAAAALVRLYTRELASLGILPHLPPRRPVLYPDVVPPAARPSDLGWTGLGILLLVLGLGLLLRSRSENQLDLGDQPRDGLDSPGSKP